MATAQSFLKVANAQLGIQENPMGSNRTKFGAWFGVNGVAWCAQFISWNMAQVGMPELRSAWCDDWVANAKNGKWGRWIGQYEAILPGDLAIFDWDGGYSDHIAAVATVNADGSWTSIEGNWQDKVSRVTRGRANIRGFVRPHWSNPAVTPAPAAVRGNPDATKICQVMLNRVLGLNITANGDYGPATEAAVKKFQQFANDLSKLAGNPKRLAVDGEIGPATLPVLHFWYVVTCNPAPAVMPVPSGNPPLRRGSPDGDTVRQLQAALNRAQRGSLKVDGVFGEETERAVIYFQTSKALGADGIYGPATAKALRAAV